MDEQCRKELPPNYSNQQLNDSKKSPFKSVRFTEGQNDTSHSKVSRNLGASSSKNSSPDKDSEEESDYDDESDEGDDSSSEEMDLNLQHKLDKIKQNLKNTRGHSSVTSEG